MTLDGSEYLYYDPPMPATDPIPTGDVGDLLRTRYANHPPALWVLHKRCMNVA